MPKKRSAPSRREKGYGILGPTGRGPVNAEALARAIDYYSNQQARLGWGTPSLAEGGNYWNLTRFSYNYYELIAMYRNQPLCRRIVDIPAEDLMRVWPKCVTETPPEDLDKVDRAIRRTATRAQILTTMKWARLFGGSGALIVIEGQEGELDQPLDLEKMGVGSYKGLAPFDMWAGISPATDVCTDPARPLDFNKPEAYNVRAPGGESFTVHASRILRFTGLDVPTPEREAQMYWGISVLEPAYEVLRMWDSVLYSVMNLTYRANILAYKDDELAQWLSGVGGTAAAAQRYEQRMSRINQLMSNQSMLIVGKEGGLEQTQYSFAGLESVFQAFQLNVCSATGIPMTRLWGRTLTGIGQTGEGDEKIYEEKIATEAEHNLRPALEKLLPVIMTSELGEVPDDLDLSFPSIRVMDDKDRTEMARAVMDTVAVAVNTGIISLRTAAKELKEASGKTDVFSNITDEEIASLPDTPQSEGELGEGMGFGETGGGVPSLAPSSGPQHVLREEGEARERERGASSQDAAEPLPAGARPGASVVVHGKRLTVRSVAPGTTDLFGRPTVQVRFTTGEVVPYYVEEGKEKAEDTQPKPPREGGTYDKVYKGVGLRKVILPDGRKQVRLYDKDGDVMDAVATYADARWMIDGGNRNKATDADGAARDVVDFHGLRCVVETPKGYGRHGKDDQGRPWRQTMTVDYGYIDGHVGADGDSLDMYLGPDSSTEWVYCVDQAVLGDRKRFDETKCMLGFSSQADALRAYDANHYAARRVFLDFTPMRVDDFKRWLKDRDPRRPCSPDLAVRR
jgi:phage-related protein (TIGR01555 family)